MSSVKLVQQALRLLRQVGGMDVVRESALAKTSARTQGGERRGGGHMGLLASAIWMECWASGKGGQCAHGVAALKRQHPDPTERHRGHDMAPWRKPHEEVEWHSDDRQEEAQGVNALGEFVEEEGETIWLAFEEESVEEGEIRDKEEGDRQLGWWEVGAGVTIMM
ncbi:hypothetical protein NDU88_002291 [Pleurodeles waltl]|uniref:Uncharacterized protein n=1 Tax=Pleurodeles waltl TaxID=8319 RepID=A0AAV7P7V7_PLEWA|nr:hypothetical protein NDU88_002291 [Pleurodeles waltl]